MTKKAVLVLSSYKTTVTYKPNLNVLHHKIHETIESINTLKTQRDFMLSFSNKPQEFIQDWLKSQSRDLKVNQNIPILSLWLCQKHWTYSSLPLVSAADDGHCWEPRGGEEDGVLPSTLGHRSCWTLCVFKGALLRSFDGIL